MVNTDNGSTRRRFLRSVPVAVTAAVAGCSSGGGSDETTAPTTESTAEPTTEPTPEETATETQEELPELPNIERQVVERDRAAVTFISRTVSGTVVSPAYTTGDAVDTDLLGVWTYDEEQLAFDSERNFSWSFGDQQYTGTWAAVGNVLALEYADGSQDIFTYSFEQGSDGPILQLFDDGEQVIGYGRDQTFDDERGEVAKARDIVVREDPEDDSTVTDDVESRSRGSGFIVSPDGYIVTNSHVAVEEDPKETLAFTFSDDLLGVIREGLADNDDLSEEEKDQIESYVYEEFWEYVQEKSEISDVQTDVNALYGRATEEEDIEVASWSADVVDAGAFATTVDGEQTIGDDIALLKVDETDLPTVPLGSADSVDTGEDIFVVGYPAIGIDETFEDRDRTLEPTLTTGIVSSRRTLLTGVEAIQTEAALNGGNSGGPMYNSDGEVVGIATFKQDDPRIEDVNFGLPIEVAKGFMARNGVENSTSEVHETFKEGLQAYWRGRCEAVRENMNSVLDSQPDHPYAQEYIEDCDSGDAPGQ